MKWKRYRFATPSEDFRPIIFPPPGPWWCSGYDSRDRAILIAFLPSDVDLKTYWPEVTEVDSVHPCDGPVFTDRFPEPDWWREARS